MLLLLVKFLHYLLGGYVLPQINYQEYARKAANKQQKTLTK